MSPDPFWIIGFIKYKQDSFCIQINIDILPSRTFWQTYYKCTSEGSRAPPSPYVPPKIRSVSLYDQHKGERVLSEAEKLLCVLASRRNFS